MSERPHLLHVFSTFAPGGPQVRTTDLLNALGQEFRHTVVAMDGNVSARERVNSEVELNLHAAPATGGPGAMPWRMRGLIRDLRPDLLLTYNWGAVESILGARLAGLRRIVHGEDGFGPEEVHGFKRRRVLARRLLFRLTSQVVVPSRNLERIVRDDFGCPPARVRYIPNGIDTEHFRPGSGEALRKELDVPRDRLVIGTVARLRAEKGLELLLEAFARLRPRLDAHLLIVGDGPERESLEQLAVQLEIADRVLLCGTLADPRDAYCAMDVMALSSHTEQMPLSVVEAMSCGRAILSTDVGDVRRMLAEENASLILTTRDAEAFAAALEALLRDAEQRQRLGQANRKRCLEEYGQDAMVDSYRQLYKTVLSGP